MKYIFNDSCPTPWYQDSMYRTIFLILVTLFWATPAMATLGYGVARTATPIFNTADITSIVGGDNGKPLKTDQCGQVRELEYVALPGTVFTIEAEYSSRNRQVFQVTTTEYRAASGIRLFLDGSFIERRTVQPAERQRSLPRQREIIAALQKRVGEPYVWGGNWSSGIPELRTGLKSRAGESMPLAGVDCSGLLYQATNGWTPRNTWQLVSFGQGVAIADKSAQEITASVQPLDLIVWQGHVLIVIDRENVIESRLECNKAGFGGVVVSSLRKRLGEIMKNRQPADQWDTTIHSKKRFVIRRWFLP